MAAYVLRMFLHQQKEEISLIYGYLDVFDFEQLVLCLSSTINEIEKEEKQRKGGTAVVVLTCIIYKSEKDQREREYQTAK